FSGVAGGYSANLFLGTNDPILSGMTTEAAHILNADYIVNATDNWFFMFVSTFLVVGIGTFITDKIVEPSLGEYEEPENTKFDEINPKAFKWANIALIAVIVVISSMVIPSNGLLRGENGSFIDSPFIHSIIFTMMIVIILSCFIYCVIFVLIDVIFVIISMVIPSNGLLRGENGSFIDSPFIHSIIFTMMLVFLIPGLTYGVINKTVKNDKDAVELMSGSLMTMSEFIVLIFFAAQFVALFEYSHIGTILSVNGAELLKAMHVNGLTALIALIIITTIINIFIAADSAKWALMAPIFVPMFMQLGVSPEVTQIA